MVDASSPTRAGCSLTPWPSSAELPGVHVHGPTGVDAITSKVGVIPFTVEGLDHGLVAAVLGYEHGIGVRSGCFCAQPYVARLLGVDGAAAASWVDRARRGDKRGAPGMVRISLGLSNRLADIDRVIGALRSIVAGDITADYCSDEHNEHHPTRRPRWSAQPASFSSAPGLASDASRGPEHAASDPP